MLKNLRESKMDERYIDLRAIRAGKGVQPVSDAGPKPRPKSRVMDSRRRMVGQVMSDSMTVTESEKRTRGPRGG